MKIGNYKAEIINSGYFWLDGGAMFGIIPKILWERTNPADEENRVQLATRNLLLLSEKRKILIDTGMGSKWSTKNKEIYKIQQDNILVNSLSNYGMNPDDITDVFLTHLHFDHTGGSTIHKEGRLLPAFPNAKYHVQKQNFEWAVNPSDRDRGSYIKDNFVPLAEEGVISFSDGDDSFDDDIQFMVINGHTFGQQMIKISDSSKTLLYCCDLFPFTSHVPLPYIMGYDLQPLVTLEEKKKILAKAADENWILFFEHDPQTAAATVCRTEKGFKVNEQFKSL